jgi:catechol 2,3-dioxygenase-like lactoylglutathione lyase family enzyme
VTTRLDLVTIDVLDPRRAAEFWRDSLGLTITEDEDDGRWLVLSDGDRRVIGLQRSTADELAARPASRLHLDLSCPPAVHDVERTRLRDLGAEELSARADTYGRIATMRAPDGTVFCLVSYA